MAIEKPLTRDDTSFKLAFDAAYLKLAKPEIRGDDVYIHVLFYGDKVSRDADGNSINKVTERCKLSDLTINIMTEDGIKAACYVYIKTMPRYQGIDV